MAGLMSASTLRKLLLCLAYIGLSGCLIRFNKFLMAKDRFPHSMFLTSCHMTASFLLCLFLYAAKPSLFPGVANCVGKKFLVMQWMLPISSAFAIALFASNQAYMYCNVSFLQFMKETNVILAFLLSCAVGLQVMNRVQLAVIIWILLGSTMAVRGEMNFVLVGFAYQLVSQVCECSRAVMGEIVLGGGGLKLDPLSYTMFIAPGCLSLLTIGNVLTWDPAIPAGFSVWWMYILPNTLLAFLLNLVVAATIQEVSAVGFVIAGTCKDIAIVLFSCLAFGETVTLQQGGSFALTLAGIACWSALKLAPESEAVRLAGALLRMPADKEPTETTALVRASVFKV